MRASAVHELELQHSAAGAGEGTFNATMAHFNAMETVNGVSANPELRLKILTRSVPY